MLTQKQQAEWQPDHYLLIVTNVTCDHCGSKHKKSRLVLVRKHIRRSASNLRRFSQTRYPLTYSNLERKVEFERQNVAYCHECFEARPGKPVATESKLVMLEEGRKAKPDVEIDLSDLGL